MSINVIATESKGRLHNKFFELSTLKKKYKCKAIYRNLEKKMVGYECNALVQDFCKHLYRNTAFFNNKNLLDNVKISKTMGL